jgi:hypothetical protein
MPIKRIFVETGSRELTGALEEYGYELVPSAGECDAYLYSSGRGALRRASGRHTALPGTLMVNTSGLNAAQVARILRTGAYSPLLRD